MSDEKDWPTLVPTQIKARDLREHDLMALGKPDGSRLRVASVYALEYDGKSLEYPVVRTGPGVHDWHSERVVPESVQTVSGMRSDLCGWQLPADKIVTVYRPAASGGGRTTGDAVRAVDPGRSGGPGPQAVGQGSTPVPALIETPNPTRMRHISRPQDLPVRALRRSPERQPARSAGGARRLPCVRRDVRDAQARGGGTGSTSVAVTRRLGREAVLAMSGGDAGRCEPYRVEWRPHLTGRWSLVGEEATLTHAESAVTRVLGNGGQARGESPLEFVTRRSGVVDDGLADLAKHGKPHGPDPWWRRLLQRMR
jgi:hypothetical protein